MRLQYSKVTTDLTPVQLNEAYSKKGETFKTLEEAQLQLNKSGRTGCIVPIKNLRNVKVKNTYGVPVRDKEGKVVYEPVFAIESYLITYTDQRNHYGY